MKFFIKSHLYNPYFYIYLSKEAALFELYETLFVYNQYF